MMMIRPARARSLGIRDQPAAPKRVARRRVPSAFRRKKTTRRSRAALSGVVILAAVALVGARQPAKSLVLDHVRIIGMADAALEAEISIEISEARARAIRAYLESEFRWDHDKFELRARGDRGAVTEEGLNRPLRSRARVVATASAP